MEQGIGRFCRYLPGTVQLAKARSPCQQLPCFAAVTEKIETQLGFQEEKEQVEQKPKKVSDSQVGWLFSASPLGGLFNACLGTWSSPKKRAMLG